MAQEYRQNYDENGNVIDPFMWIEDNNRLAGAFNGGIDRDNIPSATIASGDVSGTPFTVIHGDATDTDWTPDKTNTDWQGGSGVPPNGLTNYTWTSTEDAHYDLHWGAGIDWDGTHSIVEDDVTAADRVNDTDTVDTLQIRATIDGTEITRIGPFDDCVDEDGPYLIGSIQLPAGSHTLKVEAQVVRLVAQTGEADGTCTNAVTFTSLCWVMLERRR